MCAGCVMLEERRKAAERTLPKARIARVSWWQRIRAWWRTRRAPERLALPAPSSMPDRTREAMACALTVYRDRLEAQLGRRVSVVGVPDRKRPEPTTMTGPGERVKK